MVSSPFDFGNVINFPGKSKSELHSFRHPGEGRDLDEAYAFSDEIPAFAGMTKQKAMRGVSPCP
jgi:hypothetical protein